MTRYKMITGFLVTLLSWYSYSIELPETDSSKLFQRLGVVYKINTMTPFTGTSVEYYENGQLHLRKEYKDGKKQGLWEEYFANNQLMTTGSFTNGVMHGLWESFYENGKAFERGNLSNGLKEGLFEEFYENGEIKLEECFEMGKKIDLIICKDKLN
jgi:antitoxin component YwqK of YwqJK toxin-antitoxin module